MAVPESAQVVVIGGGCIGASALWHLADSGVRDVLLLEAATLGSGSTSKAAGGVRVQYSDELNTRIALRSLEEMKRFDELTGADIDLRQSGYLFLLDDPRHVALFETAGDLQRALGIPTRALTVDEAAEMVPGLSVDGLLAAQYSPWDGVATPEALVQGYASAARRLGARVVQHTKVLRMLIDRGRITGVETDAGTITTECVVLAAGVWSGDLARDAGLDLPVTGLRRWIHYCESDLGLPLGTPLTVDFSTSFYFHRERRGLIFGGREATLEELSEPAVRRLPALGDTPITSSWSGLYDMSPDHNALIGAAPVDGLFYATGFSGHGFQQSPAVGEHLAELARGVTPTLDLSSLTAERFARGAARVEQMVI